MSFPRYEKYKDSGVEWLGEVPEHWGLQPLWTHFRRIKRVGFSEEELLSVYRDYGVIPKSSRDDNFNNPSDDLGTYQLVEPGDLVLNKMKAWQGSVAISEYRGIVSPAYFVYAATHSANGRFLHYLMRSLRYISGYLSLSKGIRVNQWDIDPQYHSRMPIVLPSLPEQQTIAAFLDRETAKIDALVAEQQRLITLLAEKRQAIISHAVTKGLNPNAPMKDSGIEWLGEVPEHWEVVPVKWLTTHITSGPRGWSDLTGDEGAAFFQSQHIGSAMDVALIDPKRLIPPTDTDSERARLQADDVVLCITGGRTGAVAHIPEQLEEAYINQHVCLLRPQEDVLGRFLAYGLFSTGAQRQLACASYGLKQGLGLEQVNSTFLAAPPSKQEQRDLVMFLDKQTAHLDTLTQEANRAVELLKERRAALISAAVTGKIDVRGLADKEAT
ncbi:MAG TPA: hypothetical protein VN419_07240 [Humidesulfovibrio sp.]|uniref:hypothetical protein n=1 Tax=Humidesulfovibrio sp. TaxID=2910988 RepID=UPI002C53CAF3|nr:hypothetical protein [Humidesulfovibrio sp.]HWR03798.1 hypothetical protein [Humidesulfovibrio sp.]